MVIDSFSNFFDAESPWNSARSRNGDLAETSTTA
jgi:hypothetical protein